MNIKSVTVFGIIAAIAVFGTIPAGASHVTHHPRGLVVQPGMMICPRCNGYGRVPSGFLGINEKRCPDCVGTGLQRIRNYVPAPPPPPPPPPKAHHKPAPPPPPKAHHKPAPPAPPKAHHKPAPAPHKPAARPAPPPQKQAKPAPHPAPQGGRQAPPPPRK